jgi:hypothetical protein
VTAEASCVEAEPACVEVEACGVAAEAACVEGGNVRCGGGGALQSKPAVRAFKDCL